MSIKRAYTLYALIAIITIAIVWIGYPEDVKELFFNRQMLLATLGMVALIANDMKYSDNKKIVILGSYLTLILVPLVIWQGFYVVMDCYDYLLDEYEIEWKKIYL